MINFLKNSNRTYKKTILTKLKMSSKGLSTLINQFQRRFQCFLIISLLMSSYSEGLNKRDNLSTPLTFGKTDKDVSKNPYDLSNQGIPTPTQTTSPYQKCSDGNVYRYQHKCREECNGTKIQGDAKPSSSSVKPSKYSYKLVILEKNEYSISKNGSILTDLADKLSFEKQHFIIGSDGRAYICMPMLDSFLQCDKWTLDLNEFEIKGKERHLWVSAHNKHYPVTEYVPRRRENYAITCVVEETKQKKKRKTALLVTWFISIICLGAIIILSQIYPELNLKSNKILLCNFVMLFLAYTSLCIKLLLVTMSPGVCKFIAHWQQYAFLSAFCWINVQAVDVFLRFVNLRLHSADSTVEKKRFILYGIHGWGTPLWITLITVIVEAAKAIHLNPMMADECWFRHKDKAQAFLYFYGPISVILLVNTVLFVITVYKLCTLGKGSNKVKKGIKKQLLTVYMKLVVVMGLCWIMEVISAGAGGDDKIWYFTDMINALQGLFIFLVYVCKPSFIKKILKIRPESTRTRGGETTASTTNNSTLGRDISLVSQNDRL